MSYQPPARDPRRATVFGSLAEQYHRARPGYPEVAVDWLVPAGARRVVDVGAGTGKLTAALLARGLVVTAVEPDPEMLAVLHREHPGAQTHRAGADALPLADASVDAVVVGQAWHWFPHEAAAAEVRRVLRPGGRLGLAWNATRHDPGWPLEIARLDPEVLAREVGPDPGPPVPTALPTDELETSTWTWDWSLTPDRLRECLATFSVFATMDQDDRVARLDEAHRIASAESARLGTDTAAWPWRTVAVRWTPPEGRGTGGRR